MKQTEDLKNWKERLAIRFKDKTLFTQALTHSSYANEHRLRRTQMTTNGWSFLGDAVLEVVIQ